MNNVKIELDISGIERLLRQIPGRAEDVLDTAAARIEFRAKAGMKGGGTPHTPSAPGEPPHVDTGALKSSIRWWKPQQLTRHIGDGVEYGIYLEFGTSRMAARPWLTPAVEAEREPLKKAWGYLFK